MTRVSAMPMQSIGFCNLHEQMIELKAKILGKRKFSIT